MLSQKQIIVAIIMVVLVIVILNVVLWIIFRKSDCSNNHISNTGSMDLGAITLVQPSNNHISNPGSMDLGTITLVQPSKFYQDRRDGTLKYLKAVYPTSPLENLSDLQLAVLYNSLWTWYNCESSYGPSSGYWSGKSESSYGPSSGYGSGKSESSYGPSSGYGSGKSKSKSEMCWQALPGCGTKWPKLPYVAQGWIYDWNTYIGTVDKINTSVSSQINYSDSTKHPKDITGSVPGQTYWEWYNGPNPVWMYQRAIFRYTYNPGLGPAFNKNNMTYETPALTPGEITDPNLPMPWKSPTSWWTGVPSGHYLEVTMASEPGLAPSPPICWFDGWRGSGTWINVGKTLIARNKVDGVFKMSQEAAQTKEGRNTLLKYFNTSDPYQVCKNLVSSSISGKCPISGPLVYDGRPTSSTYKKNINFNFCNPNTRNQGSLVGYFAQTNMNNASNFYVTDWYDWCDEQESPMPNSCVDKMRLGTYYRADRQAVLMTFDEPLFALGQYLGYDSIQLPHSSNGNGRYQYEYLELRGYPKEVRNRDYSSFMMAIEGAPIVVDYRVDFLVDYMPKLQSLFSIRDILDPMNGDSKPFVADAMWVDSVRIPKKRPPVKENFTTADKSFILQLTKHKVETNASFRKYRSLSSKVAGDALVDQKPTKENSLWEDGCPINKLALGELWEYNLTCKDHISAMFTYLSISFSPSSNYCSPQGLGRATSVGKYSVMREPSDAPYG